MSTVNTPLAIMSQRAAGLAESSGQFPWRQVPKFAEPLHVRGSIACPNPNNSYVEVATFTVQAGYAAVLTAILCNYVGQTAPIEGLAADLFYSLRVDEQYFPNYFGAINTTLGSLGNGPYPIPGFVRLKAGQKVQGLVTVPATSNIATGAPNRILFHLIGYEYPDR